VADGYTQLIDIGDQGQFRRLPPSESASFRL
jgi:hypothetical protein